MSIDSAVRWLESMGFHFTASEDGRVDYSRHADWPIDPEAVRPYLAKVKASKAEVVEFLLNRQAKHDAWLVAYEAWEADPDPANDAQHKKRIADAAVAARLPFYLDGENDSGPEGWESWAKESEMSSKATVTSEDRAIGNWWCKHCQKYHPPNPPVEEYEYARLLREAREKRHRTRQTKSTGVIHGQFVGG